MGTSMHTSLSNEAWEKRLGSARHTLYEIDLENKTAFCIACGRTKIRVSAKGKGKSPKAICLNRYLAVLEAGKEKRRFISGKKPRHTLSEIDSEKLTAICSVCGPTSVWKYNNKGSTRYACAYRERDYWRNYQRNYRSSTTSHPNAHALSNIDEEKKTAVCSQCGPVSIYLWQGKKKVGRRCSNATVRDIPGALEIRREINTNAINRFKIENGCKRCGYKSNLLRLTIYSTIGRKSAVKIGKLLRLNKADLQHRLENCEVFCIDCR